MTEVNCTEIVIKIPDRIYYGIENGITKNGSVASQIVLNAVKDGIQLPKGHGRLIDADEIEECKEIMNTITGESKYAVRMDDIRNMPAIIEADKGG